MDSGRVNRDLWKFHLLLSQQDVQAAEVELLAKTKAKTTYSRPEIDEPSIKVGGQVR